MGDMTARALDYGWFRLLFPDLAKAYCFTLIRGMPPEQFLGRLGATGETRQLKSVDALAEAAEPGFIAATEAGNWTLAIEPGGVLGTTEGRMRSLSNGTRLVAHSREASAVDRFCWLENGTPILTFAPLYPTRRSGAEAHEWTGLMRDVGFAVDGEDLYREGVPGAPFALAQELTGVRITPALLDETPFTCAVVPVR